jgi:Protein of unknown function (DUF1592)/Protein of unknown function (DUF1588)/Protein of unknown function (DUF1587)/Protein of unknown function (DUF1585)/Protein of unknown function (DUF1595)
MRVRRVFICLFFVVVAVKSEAQDTIDYVNGIRPLLSKSCFSCHNTNMPKAGVNLDNYREKERVIKDGQFWLKVLDVIKTRSMPPKSEKPLTDGDYHTLVTGINSLLQSSLQQKNPGHVVIRRLSHNEYQYTMLDLVQVQFDAKNAFPSDGSGGGGFDNQGRALFFTPLKLERYYDAADNIIQQVYNDPEKWNRIVPIEYKQNWWHKFLNWVKSIFSDDYKEVNPPALAAEKVVFPFATKAFRRFLKDDEKAKLINIFQNVYDKKDSIKNPQRFNESVAQVFKTILVSPNFLYKVEEEPEMPGSYPLSNFEVAARLSYFLWSSMPDDELFKLAYLGKLQDTLVLEAQAKRMLADPKAKRFAENFAVQWLGIAKLTDNQPMVDPEKYPGFDMPIRKALYRETVEYFYHVLTGSKNMLDLITSNYTFLSKELADFYGIKGVTNEDFQKYFLNDSTRGGVLGMGSVLATTSFPLRTSPVIRGKWVMEQLLGISPPPPPEVVAELTEDKATHDALGLRKILEMHRSKPECQSCHEKMDPLGLGLENFDPTGRWRTSYGKVPVDASGVMADGKTFNGPTELKKLLLGEKAKIARNLSTKMLSYALGRSIIFTDEPAVRRLELTLLNSNFNPESFIIELVKSYPFRKKINDFEKKV